MKIKSQALSQNKGLVEYEAVKRWDGAMPQIMLGNGSTPFIDLRNIQNEQNTGWRIKKLKEYFENKNNNGVLNK